MQQNPSWEANTQSASQDIALILCNLNVNYRNQKSRPPNPILSQMDPINTIPPCFISSILILSLYLSLSIQSSLFQNSQPKFCKHVSFYFTYIFTLFGHPNNSMGYVMKSMNCVWRSSLCSFPQPPVTSSLLTN
jgi:hypothetical protein